MARGRRRGNWGGAKLRVAMVALLPQVAVTLSPAMTLVTVVRLAVVVLAVTLLVMVVAMGLGW